MFKRKKRTLEEISLGELKMELGNTQYKIEKTRKEIAELDGKIKGCLESCNSTIDASVLENLGHEVTIHIEQQRNLNQKLSSFLSKYQVLQRLIAIKEENTSIFGKKGDILDELDMESLLASQENKEIETEIHEARTENLLKNIGVNNDYDKVLSILKSASYDGESLNLAKAELDNLVLKKNQ